MAAIATTALHWGPVQFGRLVGFCQGANHDKSCRSWKLHLKWSHRQLQKWNFKRIFHPVFTEKKKKKRVNGFQNNALRKGNPKNHANHGLSYEANDHAFMYHCFEPFFHRSNPIIYDPREMKKSGTGCMQDTFWLQVSQNKETAHRVPESPSQVIFCPKKIQSRRPILSRAKFSSNHFWSSWVVSCPLTREATKPAMKPSFMIFEFVVVPSLSPAEERSLFDDCFLPTKGAS